MCLGGIKMIISELEFLERRYDLDREQQLELELERKGKVGEFYFKNLMDNKLNDNIGAITDYRFESGGSECQIDFLIVLNNTCIIIEIKNFYGDFELRENGFYRLNPLRKIKNPLSQTERAEIMLKNHLKRLNLNLDVRYYVVFVNDQCSIYQLTRDKPIVMASQLNRFLESLNEEAYDKNHSYTLKKLESARLKESRYNLELKLDFSQARKGLTCQSCSGWLEVETYNSLKCRSCGADEKIDDAIRRSITEMKTLFPNDAITLSRLSEWIGHAYTPSKLRRLLNVICHSHGDKKGRHYTLKGDNTLS